MLYFKYLGLIGGGWIVLVCLLHFIFSSKYPNLIVEKMLPEKRPAWLFLVAAFMTGLTVYTWFRFFGYMNAFSLIISLFLTSGFVKTVFFIVSYEPMRTLSVALMTREKVAFHIILGCFLALGVGLLYVSLILS